MKKIILLSLTMLTTLIAIGQFPSDAYEKANLTWFGIDYTKAHFVGHDAFNDPEKIVEDYFGVWNSFVEAEAEKYNVPKYLRKSDVEIDITVVRDKNEAFDSSTIPHDKAHELDDATIQSIVSGHSYGDHSGMGGMLIAENYNKNKKHANYTFVLFDIGSKQIKFSKRYTVDAGGFGFRNYWARTYYEALRKIDKDMKKWL